MKKLLKISFDLSLLSLTPILSWFILSLTINKNLINVFTITYPFQFIYYIIISIFSTGANIAKEKDHNQNSVMSGILIGSVISLILFIFILTNIEKYISFMNMDVSIYKIFTIYSIIDLYISIEFAFLLNKLYFSQKNDLANQYSLIHCILKLTLLTILSLLTKNQILIIVITLTIMGTFTLCILVKNSDSFKIKFNLLKCIKYDSVELFNNIILFFVHLLGFSAALNYSEKYTTALTFETLITDTQWDTLEAIVTKANIDITSKQFNYKYHLKNSIKLLGLLLFTSFLMFILLHHSYNINYSIFLIYFLIEAFNLILYPLYRLKTCYLQLEWNAIPTTVNKIIAVIGRLLVTSINSPFCTSLGLLFASMYQFITVNIMFKKNYNVSKKGTIILKNSC